MNENEQNAGDAEPCADEQHRPPSREERRKIAEVRRHLAHAKPALDKAESMQRVVAQAQPLVSMAEEARRKLERAAGPLTDLVGQMQPNLPRTSAADNLLGRTAAPKINYSQMPGLFGEANSRLSEAITGSITAAAFTTPVTDMIRKQLAPAMDFRALAGSYYSPPKINYSQMPGLFGEANSRLSEAITGSITAAAFTTPVTDMIRKQLAPAMDFRALAGSYYSPPKINYSQMPGLFETNPKLTEALRGWMGTSAFGPQVMSGMVGVEVAAMLNSALPRIDLSAFDRVARVTEFAIRMPGLPAILAPSFKIPVPDMSGILGGASDHLQRMVASLLGRWTSLADMGHVLAGLGRKAALRARAAALREDLDEVIEFAMNWLGLRKVPKPVLVSVIAALLDPGWEQVEPDLTIPTLNRIRRREARGHAELIGSKAKGDLRVHSLNIARGEFPAQVTPLWPQQPDLDLVRLEGFDPRVERVLDQLTDVEREIAMAWAFGGRTCTWPEAAAECGYGPKEGESVRRKLSRLGDRFSQRNAAA